MKCKQGTCDNIEKLHDKLNKALLCIKGKVGWGRLGLTVLALVGVITTITLYSMAAEKKQNEKIGVIPVIQTDIEHIKQDMRKMDSKLDKIEEKRDHDVEVLHQRITKSEEKILKAIQEIKK